MIGRAAYVPDFRVRINGDDLPQSVRASVVRVQLDTGIPSLADPEDLALGKAADRVELEIANPGAKWLEGHIRGLGFRPFPAGVKVGPIKAAVASDGLFDLDNTLELALGYQPGPLVDLFKGDITGVEAKFPDDGMPTLTLIAHNYLHRLNEGSYARGFGPLPDWVIAGILSAENFLLPLIDPAVAAASTAIAVVNAIFRGSGRKQIGQSDLEFLKEIADLYDADFWVDGDTLVLSRFIGKEYSPSVFLRWGESLRSFNPKVSSIGQVAAVGARFTLPLVPQLDFLVTVGWDFNAESLSVKVIPGAAAVMGPVAGPMMSLIDRTLNNPADIAASAMVVARTLRTIINNRVVGRGSAVGDPNLHAGAVVRVEGVGQDFSGDYRVTAANHVLDGRGYRTDFQVRKEIIP